MKRISIFLIFLLSLAYTPLEAQLAAEANWYEGMVVLHWQAVNAAPLSHFEILKVDVSGQKRRIGSISTKGDPFLPENYVFVDASPDSSALYLLLEMGREEKAPMSKHELIPGRKFLLLPPPFPFNHSFKNDSLLLSSTLPIYGKVRLQVWDGNGRERLNHGLSLKGEAQGWSFQASSWPSGIYYLELFGGQEKNIYKVFKP